jgi:hypothetical protein|tara:strand:- start:791 stop:1465 length:675 start_codon:yes stop_codon:yes gene_type:complete
MNDSTILTDPYIYVINDILSEDKCNKIIEKFNRKKAQQIQGRTGGGLNTNVKNSRDIQITHSKGWKREDKLFHDIIAEGHRRYYDHLNDPMVNNFVHFTNNMKRHIFSPFYADQKTLELMDTGYQIQKTEPGKGYVWHDDFSQYGTTDSPEIRYLTFILYLNTVEEGWTQFYNGNQVSPKSGRLVFFPATWTYVHQGYPPKQTKYIMTGWMHTKVKAPEQNGKN